MKCVLSLLFRLKKYFIYFFILLTKQEILLGSGAWVESRRVREPRRTALPRGCSLRFYRDGISGFIFQIPILVVIKRMVSRGGK